MCPEYPIVAPFTGAWIETRMDEAETYQFTNGRTLYGCVD